jgi:serine kinase of HPr protein (carbohydrate metabolism regulator)
MSAASPGPLHGTCLSLAGEGVLLLGPPGSGKSDLALRLLDQPGFGTGGQPLAATLVADDQVVLEVVGGRLLARAPTRTWGLLEVRGLGLVTVIPAGPTPLSLVVHLKPQAAIARLPEAEVWTHAGVAVPAIALDPASPSAPARLRSALNFHAKRSRE